MKPDEVPPVLDVHPPHHAPHGVRDFLIHLFTITIGLLIALSLEGVVEWHHHKHLAHDAAASMRNEIASNAKGAVAMTDDLKTRQDQLTHDVTVLNFYLKNHKMPPDKSMAITFNIGIFDNVAWRTSQTTGALSYMPYDEAENFSSIYNQQELLAQSIQVATRDAMIAVAPFALQEDDKDDPTPAQAQAVLDKIGILKSQLFLVNTLLQGLNQQYTAFLKTHPQ